MKKKAEVESLWAQVSQLRTENERLKEAVRVSAPKTTESILMNCNFTLPKKVSDLVDKMLAAGCLSGINKSDLRSFCIINATAPDGPIVYASRHFVELTGYEMHSILGHNCRFLQGPDTDRNEVNYHKKSSNYLPSLQLSHRYTMQINLRGISYIHLSHIAPDLN